jgi:hypothetical protein
MRVAGADKLICDLTTSHSIISVSKDGRDNRVRQQTTNKKLVHKNRKYNRVADAECAGIKALPPVIDSRKGADLPQQKTQRTIARATTTTLSNDAVVITTPMTSTGSIRFVSRGETLHKAHNLHMGTNTICLGVINSQLQFGSLLQRQAYGQSRYAYFCGRKSAHLHRACPERERSPAFATNTPR